MGLLNIGLEALVYQALTLHPMGSQGGTQAPCDGFMGYTLCQNLPTVHFKYVQLVAC